ncbi:unnamed protein product [Euphydryas editha]|nr:unnamed protein product [Euphydryas editha]
MEPRVVGGDRVPITSFPHSAFLVVSSKMGSFVCGSSVINQKILLTAAHCIDSCVNNCKGSRAYAGSANKKAGDRVYFLRTMIHEEYSRKQIKNDIGLILLESPLRLGKLIKRVALLRKPPSTRLATLAGWGMIDERLYIYTDYLHSVKQNVWNFEECKKKIPTIPNGTICAGDVRGQKYASEGDSGSALIVDKYIQIGIVSYKRPDISRAIVIYTDVSYFYNWIKKNSRNIYCNYV